MLRRTLFLSGLMAVVAFATVGCQPLENDTGAGGLSTSELASTAEIPLEMGELVSVTPMPGSERTVLLWFVKPDQTITVVGMNVATRKLGNEVVTIERY